MKTDMGKITNLHTLEMEMEKMKLRLNSIENKLDENMKDLQENAGSMAFNSVLGLERKQKLDNFLSGLTEKFIDNPKLQNNINKWVDKLADKLADSFDTEEE